MGSALLVVNAQGRPLLTHAAYEQMIAANAGEFQAEDLEGRPLPPDQMPQLRAAHGETFSMEFVVADRDGARHWFEAVGNPLRDERDRSEAVKSIRVARHRPR